MEGFTKKQTPSALFSPISKKLKNPTQKKFFLFQEMELLSSNFKKVSGYRNLEKKSLYFRKRKPQKRFLYFKKWTLSVHPEKSSYTSGNGSPKRISYFLSKESCFYISGNGNLKKFLTFQETELSYISETLKNFSRPKSKKKVLIFQKVTCKA